MENQEKSSARWEVVSFLTSDYLLHVMIQEAGRNRLICGEVFVEEEARLIAAAPELRAASQKLYDALQNYLIDVPDRDLPQWLVEGMDDLEAAWHKVNGTVPEPQR